jgi:catechol 2,3-dioxygenase-like lactoylglutathione lyase family enzyme
MAIVTPPYHFALVVEDLEAAMAEMSQVLGLTWSKVQRRTSTHKDAQGVGQVEMAFVYSLQGPPHFELIERREGTVFDKLGLHHIGVWSDDPKAESARLDAHGWPFERVGLKADGSWGGGLYHRGTGDLRIEIVDIASSGPKYVRFMNGGDYA